MPLTDSYGTLAGLKSRLAITDTNDDTRLQNALNASREDIEGVCGRQFNTNAGASGSGAGVTYTGTGLVDTGAAFYSAQIGQLVTSGVNTATITAVTNATTLVVTAWAPGTPSAAAAYTIPPVVSARAYYPDDLACVYVDDFATSTGFIYAADYSNGTTYASIIAAANYQLEPLNGVVDGTPGWPFYRIRAIQTWNPLWLATIGYPRASIQITAQWGWPAVPASVVEAGYILAEETFSLKDAKFGVAGFGAYGVVRVRENPKVMALLTRYIREPIQVR